MEWTCDRIFTVVTFIFSGALEHAACEFEHLSLLRKDTFGPAAMTRCCRCAPHQPSVSDNSGSLLVVRSLTAPEALRTTLQPYCDESSTGGLTARLIRQEQSLKSNCGKSTSYSKKSASDPTTGHSALKLGGIIKYVATFFEEITKLFPWLL